jgi:hypothetical protein
MSQVAELPEAPTTGATENEPRVLEGRPSSESGQFDYRPVPVTAVVGCILGVLSCIALLGMGGIVIAALGTIISAVALLRIAAARGGLGGTRLATVGLVLSLTFLVSGSVYLAHLYRTEVPDGFERVNFSADISKKGFISEGGVSQIHPDVGALVGKDVFLKGFMYPVQQTTGLQSFLLCKDNDVCCFGGQPALQDMVGVIMESDRTVDFYAGRVSVAGTFEINTGYSGQGSLEPLYVLRTRVFSKSRTAF